MERFDIKKNEDTIEVTVNVGPIGKADDTIDVVRVANVREFLKAKGIAFGKALEVTTVTNRHGPAAQGIFIFEKPVVAVEKKPSKKQKRQQKPLRTGPAVEKVIKDLTPPPEAAIIEEQPKKKRKRVKRVSKTGNQTTS